MTETEFIKLAEGVFAHIERVIDAGGADIECTFNGPVLELEFTDGTKVIINRHTLNREIWLAAKSGGFHYCYHEGQWISRRDDSGLFEKLSELVRMGSGEMLVF